MDWPELAQQPSSNCFWEFSLQSHWHIWYLVCEKHYWYCWEVQWCIVISGSMQRVFRKRRWRWIWQGIDVWLQVLTRVLDLPLLRLWQLGIAYNPVATHMLITLLSKMYAYNQSVAILFFHWVLFNLPMSVEMEMHMANVREARLLLNQGWYARSYKNSEVKQLRLESVCGWSIIEPRQPDWTSWHQVILSDHWGSYNCCQVNVTWFENSNTSFKSGCNGYGWHILMLLTLWSFFGFVLVFFWGHGKRGATVYLLCRNKERGVKAVENIRTKTGNPNVSLEVSFLAPL